MNIAVFVSGNGSNLQAIIDACLKGEITSKLEIVISNKEDAYALERAQKAGIETFTINPKEYTSRQEYDSKIIEKLKEKNIDFIVLAGYMRLLSDLMVQTYKDKIINVHPALLPLFKGTHAIKDAFEAKVKETGVTIHFVDEKLDNGPIILQDTIKIEEADTLQTLEEKIHVLEHELYPKVIKLIENNKVSINGRSVSLLS